MNNKCLLLALAALIIISYCNTVSSIKLKEKFQKLNQYLVKNVKSENVETNMAQVEQLIGERSSLRCIFGESCMIDSLLPLEKFSTISSNATLCNSKRGRVFVESIDHLLASGSNITSLNYPLSRTDKLLEHYAFEIVRRCPFDRRWPKMDYGFKQLAYDELNEQLMNNLPKIEDVKTNMAMVAELSDSLFPSNGSLVVAMKQFLALNSTLNVESCGVRGYKILLKNELGARANAHGYFNQPLRRVEKIFDYFARQHQELCRPIVRREFGSKLNSLDQDTYRKVLGLVSSYFLGNHQYADMMVDVNQKEVDEDFTIPMIVEHVSSVYVKYKYNYRITRMDPRELYFYAKAVSLGDPDSKCLDPKLNKKLAKEVECIDKLKILLIKYLIKPCDRYLKLFEELIEADEYDSTIVATYHTIAKDKFSADLVYHMIHSGYQICEFVNSNQRYITDKVRQFAML